MNDAANVVTNSAAWADSKDEFWRQQQEFFDEFLADNNDRIESIRETYTMDGTLTEIRMKPSD